MWNLTIITNYTCFPLLSSKLEKRPQKHVLANTLLYKTYQVLFERHVLRTLGNVFSSVLRSHIPAGFRNRHATARVGTESFCKQPGVFVPVGCQCSSVSAREPGLWDPHCCLYRGQHSTPKESSSGRPTSEAGNESNTEVDVCWLSMLFWLLKYQELWVWVFCCCCFWGFLRKKKKAIQALRV